MSDYRRKGSESWNLRRVGLPSYNQEKGMTSGGVPRAMSAVHGFIRYKWVLEYWVAGTPPR